MPPYEFIPLSKRPPGWNDLIRGYPGRTLFHEVAWLDHLLSIHPTGRIQYFQIVDGKRPIGYHCGLRIKKLMIPIHGSPLGGTGTNFMGPLVLEGTHQQEVIRALVRLLSPKYFLHLELSNPLLDANLMKAEGFHEHPGVTHLVHLQGAIGSAWSNLKSTCRNRIRKAQKSGLVVERTDDPAIIDHFYAQFKEVYNKQGMVTPFTRDRPASLFANLLPAQRLLPLWVKRRDEVAATGLFPYDENAIYFWGAASWIRFHKLCPNELLHWEVLRFASNRGIPVYNMCGGTSQFKDKFGGEDVPYAHYTRSAIPGLHLARKLYRAYHFWRLKI